MMLMDSQINLGQLHTRMVMHPRPLASLLIIPIVKLLVCKLWAIFG